VISRREVIHLVKVQILSSHQVTAYVILSGMVDIVCNVLKNTEVSKAKPLQFER